MCPLLKAASFRTIGQAVGVVAAFDLALAWISDAAISCAKAGGLAKLQRLCRQGAMMTTGRRTLRSSSALSQAATPPSLRGGA